nr:hypothetical protein Q903MT_gene772 [Picea sitchensis]
MNHTSQLLHSIAPGVPVTLTVPEQEENDYLSVREALYPLLYLSDAN